MSGPMDRAEETALWRHWRTAVVNADGEAGPAPDPLLLAAYAEHRLDEAAAEEMEAWVARHPEAMADVLAARDSNVGPPTNQPSEAALARAMALVSDPDRKVVPFRRPATRTTTWRNGIA